MKKLIIPLAILAMLVLLAAAAAWDCVRLAGDARYRVTVADDEMQKHEQRLVKTLAGFATVPLDVKSAIAEYQVANTPDARHQAYDELVTAFQSSMAGEIDSTNPLSRKFMDDVAGAINRRQIAQKQFDAEFAAYQNFLNSRRGRVARSFSSRASADWEDRNS